MHQLARPLILLAAAALAVAPAAAGPALLFDAKDGRVLYAEDQDNVWHPASLTKIMTAYMTFEAIKAGKLTMQSRIAASEVSTQQAPSKVGLPIGATMTVELALQALIIKSANDVAVMLAEAISGDVDTFAQQMTATAKRLGMKHSHFVNPHGLPAPEQVTTARDLGLLSMAVLRDFPEHAALWTQADMRIGRRRLRSHNGLLRTYDGADGLKTGFICDSGYNVVATASRDGRRVVAVVLGESSGAARNIRAAGLLEHGFETASWREAVQQNFTVKTLPVPTDAKTTPTIVRQELVNRECGGRGRRKPAQVAAVAKVKQQRAELAKKAAAVAPATKGAGASAQPPSQPPGQSLAPAAKAQPATKAAN